MKDCIAQHKYLHRVPLISAQHAASLHAANDRFPSSMPLVSPQHVANLRTTHHRFPRSIPLVSAHRWSPLRASSFFAMHTTDLCAAHLYKHDVKHLANIHVICSTWSIRYTACYRRQIVFSIKTFSNITLR